MNHILFLSCHIRNFNMLEINRMLERLHHILKLTGIHFVIRTWFTRKGTCLLNKPIDFCYIFIKD